MVGEQTPNDGEVTVMDGRVESGLLATIGGEGVGAGRQQQLENGQFAGLASAAMV